MVLGSRKAPELFNTLNKLPLSLTLLRPTGFDSTCVCIRKYNVLVILWFKFCVGISRQCPSGLCSLYFLLFPSGERPRDDLAERSPALFDLIDILGQLSRLLSFGKYSLGFFLPLLGRQEKEETGDDSLALLGFVETWDWDWLCLEALPLSPPSSGHLGLPSLQHPFVASLTVWLMCQMAS